jgi:hypothetical protein
MGMFDEALWRSVTIVDGGRLAKQPEPRREICGELEDGA